MASLVRCVAGFVERCPWWSASHESFFLNDSAVHDSALNLFLFAFIRGVVQEQGDCGSKYE
jgi:hypothetical protein